MALHIAFHHPVFFFPNVLYLFHLSFCPFHSILSFLHILLQRKNLNLSAQNNSHPPTCEDLALRYIN